MSATFTEDINPDLSARLKTARAASGLSTREVVEKLPDQHKVSHASIANYESGRSSPTLALLSALADTYRKPLAWFLTRDRRLTGVRYRCRKSQLTKSDKEWYEANASQLLDAYSRLEKELGRPLKKIFDLKPVQEESPAQLASRIRKLLKLNDADPITSVVEVLEKFGIRTIELATDLPIDGVAGKFGDEHAVVLNSNTSNDRCRINGMHEQIHVLEEHCHSESDPHDKAMETRAQDAASHVLLPESQLKEAFRGQSMVRLVQYKERFGISLAAMIYRAQKAEIIPDSTSKWLWIEFTKRGWRKNEPGNVRPDRATRFEQLLDEAISNKEFSWSDLARLTGLCEDDLKARRRFALGLMGSDEDHDEEGGETDSIPFPRA